MLTPERLATVIELALYRVSDRLANDGHDLAIQKALREVAEQVANLLREK